MNTATKHTAVWTPTDKGILSRLAASEDQRSVVREVALDQLAYDRRKAARGWMAIVSQRKGN